MKTFTIKSKLVKHSDAVTKKAVGDTKESVSSIVSNTSYSSEDKFKGRITIAELLTLEPSPDDEDMYLVYSDDTYDDEGNFILYGEEYKNGTFVMWMIDCWRPLSNDVAEATIQGDNDLPIDVVFTENPQDNRVPSTKLVYDITHILWDLILEAIYRFSDYVSKSSLAKTLEEYCTLDYLKENYVTKSLIELAFSLTVAKKDLDSEVSTLGYTKNAGTITEVKLNGNTIATGGSADIQTSYVTERSSSLLKVATWHYDSAYARWGGVILAISERDDVDVNPLGFLVIKYGRYSSDGSTARENHCQLLVWGKTKSQTGSTKFYVDTADLSNPVLYAERSRVSVVTLTPMHAISEFRLLNERVSSLPADCLEVKAQDAHPQANWNETNTESLAYIRNKPDNLLTDNNCVEKLASHGIGRYALVFRIYGDYARYQYQILRYYGVTLDTSRTSSSSTKPNLDLCVTIEGMEDENDYCDFLEKHQLHLSYSGETNNGEFKQVEALGSVTVRTVNSDSFLHIRFGSNAFITDRQVTVSLAFEHMTAW